MKHKIKKSKTRKKYSKRVSKKVTKRPKKGLKLKKKNSRKNKIKKGGDATTTIGLAAAAIGLGTAAMYIRRNRDPTDENNLEKHYLQRPPMDMDKSSPNKKTRSKGTYLNADDQKNIATQLLNLHSKINQKNGSADDTDKKIYSLACGTYMIHPWFPLEKDINDNIVVKNKHQAEYNKLLKPATQSLVDSGTSSHNNQLGNYAKLNQDIKDIYRSEIKTIFEKIQKEKDVTNGEYRLLEDLYEQYQQQPEFPLQGNIQSIGVEETKGEEEPFNVRIGMAIKKKEITMNPN